jgi:NhaP-type Na+/H+ or K+/H+ antiporter
MALFESLLVLLALAVLLLQVSRRFAIPYPSILALAGLMVAALPSSPKIDVDPDLALALFIAPALLGAAYDIPPRTLRKQWRPLIALAGIAVLLTTAAVAWVGVTFAALPLAAAIALGAIVAPPDAAAATAILGQLSLPRRTVLVLQGESLLNDAVTLLVFTAAVGAHVAGGITLGFAAQIAFAAPAGIAFGIVVARLYVLVAPRLKGTLAGTLSEFATTFGVWIIAGHLKISAVLAVVAYAMVISRFIPRRQSARDRIHSYSVWNTTVFLLNVVAFLLMGLLTRQVVLQLPRDQIWSSLGFASLVFATVVLVRIGWVLGYNRAVSFWERRRGSAEAPTLAVGIVVSWCGMRGLVTLAAALALPLEFPQRELIQLSALTVVIGSLIFQGLTLAPLIKALGFAADGSFKQELSAAQVQLLDVALSKLDGASDPDSEALREVYLSERESASRGGHPREERGSDAIKRRHIKAQRQRLTEMRSTGVIEDDIYHALEGELDWAEMAVSPPEKFEILEG